MIVRTCLSAVAAAVLSCALGTPALAEAELAPELAALTRLEVQVTMRDGVQLATDVYLPPGDGPFVTLYTASPYNARQDPNSTLERRMAAKGYVFVHQNVRGRFGSGGKFSPFVDEIPDLTDTVNWIVAQPWCNGKIGLVGNSSQSYSNQLLASTQHPALGAMVNIAGLTNTWELFFPGGAFRLDTLYPWMQFFYLGKPIREMAEWQRRFRHRPMAENFEWGADLYYKMARGNVPVEKIRIPTMHIVGWNDVVYRQSLMLHRGIPGGVEQRLVLGPWMHNQIGSDEARAGDQNFGAEAVLDQDALAELVTGWFDHHLKGSPAPKAPRASVFVMGQGWREFDAWPPANAVAKQLYLAAGRDSETVGSLQEKVPATPGSRSFEFDPANPVLTYGGVNSHIFVANAGPRDQARFDVRSDVLRFVSTPAASAYTLAGPMNVVLYASSNAPDTDFTAKLSVVQSDGYVRIVEDGIVRASRRNGPERNDPIQPGQVVRYEIDLGQTALRIEPGQRLRLDISSSNFPKYDLNPNSSENAFTAVSAVAAQQKIEWGKKRPSVLTVTVLDAAPKGRN